MKPITDVLNEINDNNNIENVERGNKILKYNDIPKLIDAKFEIYESNDYGMHEMI